MKIQIFNNVIENATHNIFANITWILSASISGFGLQMYCGLHFQFCWAHFHSWKPCILSAPKFAEQRSGTLLRGVDTYFSYGAFNV
jgi:hypothetical protein